MRSATIILSSLIGLTAAGIAIVYGASEWKLKRAHSAPLVELTADPVASDPNEGRRMARIVGCWAGCHGMEGEGDTDDMPGAYSVTAPTLSSVVPSYSDAELVRLIRYGVKRDGRSAVGMSSYTFYPLADADLASIIGHLRRQPARPAIERKRAFGLEGRFKLLLGEWQTSADQVDRSMPRWGELPRRDAFERGRYLASITCSECHGLAFRGNPFEGGPSLIVIAGYDLPQFRKLLRTGVPLGGRDLGVMAWVARNAFVDFTDAEVADIYTFLSRYQGIEGERN
jgi:cytochrome c553